MTEDETRPLIKQVVKREEEWLKAAQNSECARNIDAIFKDKQNTEAVEMLKKEMFQMIYDMMGGEIDGKDLVRALVVTNEKFGDKTTLFLNIITLGVFMCFRPRDDDTILVVTKDGNVAKLKVARPYCCPGTVPLILLTMLKYFIILTLLFVMPMLVYCLITNKTISEELHELHLDKEGFRDLPAFLRRNYLISAITLVIFILWVCSLLPHDYREKQRRRHMVREISAGQFNLYGPLCCRRSRMRLFFGTYPSQAMLDMVGTLDLRRSVGPIPPSRLSEHGLSVLSLITIFTLLLTIVTCMDTTFAWLDRSLALSHLHSMQAFCSQTPADKNKCTRVACEDFSHAKNLTNKFCTEVGINNDKKGCTAYGKAPPCCGGCITGASTDYLDEGPLATFKVLLSLFADIGTLAITFLVAKYALGIAKVTDHIDVHIMRRSRTRFKSELANFEWSVPLAVDFLENVFKTTKQKKTRHSVEHIHESETVDKKWQGVQNFEVDTTLKEWDQFFQDDLKTPPETRWTSKLKVPTHCLGMCEDEKVYAAWLDMPLMPPTMTFMQFLMGGLWFVLFPQGKVQHATIVTDRRVFYMRHQRPTLPLWFLQTSLRVDMFRHDFDVFYGYMERTKIPPIQRLVHESLLLEWWLPGKVFMQNRFGVLEINRTHGDIIDVYNVISQLTRISNKFVEKSKIQAAGLDWGNCQKVVNKMLTQKTNKVWVVNPQPDDVVEPTPEIRLRTAEELVYSLSVKDVGSVWSPYYTNTDVIITTGRIFIWSRNCYKKFDCAMLHYWCCCWAAFLNPMFNAKNLANSIEFVNMPAVLSFSTDMNVEPPLWHIPHHTPLKCPCIETCCAMLTRKVTGDNRDIKFNARTLSIIPKRSAPIIQLQMIWRLKQSAHAISDMLLLHSVKPHFLTSLPASDMEDFYNDMGLSSDDALVKENILQSQQQEDDEKVETLRTIMGVVQDTRNSLLDQIDRLV